MNKKWLWRTAAVVAVAIGVFLGSYVHAHAATASTAKSVCVKHPSARNCPAVLNNQGAWSASLYPADLYFGNGHAPYLTGLSWPVYQHSEAKAHGILHAYKTACIKGPNPSGCKQYKIKISLLLNHTKFHCGSDGNGCQDGYYYSVLNDSYTGKGLNMPHRWVARKGYWQ